jgi:FkbM family methyltransferase
MWLERIRMAARACGIELKRYSRLRRAIDMLAASGDKPFFVQIGANNGIDFDNFFETVTGHRLPGLVVEPVADYHAALVHAYARYPEVKAIRAAIHPRASSLPIYRVAADKAQFLWHHGLASFEREHLTRHGVPEEAIVAEEVPCLSIAGLAALLPAGRSIDILVTDTEGFDAEILRMIDFSSIRPSAIRFENKHMSTADRVSLSRLLDRQGYSLSHGREDSIAIDRSLRCGPISYLRALWPRR